MAKCHGINFHPLVAFKKCEWCDIYKQDITRKLVIRSDYKILQGYNYKDKWGDTQNVGYTVRGKLRDPAKLNIYISKLKENGWFEV